MKNRTGQQDVNEDGDDKPIEGTISNNKPNPLPVAVSLTAKPSPPRTLNNLEEAGRVRLTLHFAQHYQKQNEKKDGMLVVDRVNAKITNNTRARSSAISLPMMTTSHDWSMDIPDNFEEGLITYYSPYSAAELAQKEPDTWYGEIVIPCNWFEGGSKTYERTGSFSPYYDDNLFTMTISWVLLSNNNDIYEESMGYTVELHSTDAFHWEQQ
ncbi:MAG TPA: hypothetical protein VNI77_01315 [Nitrososphaera sp.]|nr:hypothetical protein [Nitrososphaera sp.]